MNKLYHKRWLSNRLLTLSQVNPVVVVTGARQVGKSTLLRHLFSEPEWRHLSLDDLDVLGQAQKDPSALLADPRPLVLDEVQREPRLLLAIKKIVDRHRKERRFVLSGSANLLLMAKVSESLAGRAVFLHLDPFTWGEIQELDPSLLLNQCLEKKMNVRDIKVPRKLPSKTEWASRIYDGWLPVVALEKSQDQVATWLEGYVTSYLERDLRQLSQIDSLADFRRMLRALAHRSGNLLNQSEVARDLAIKQPTLHRYVNLLETSEWYFRLPAYSVNRTKRLVKTPKGYFFDSGLAAFLAGETRRESDFPTPLLGALLETAVFQHLRVWSNLQIPKAQCFYWRTLSGSEVDFVLEWGKELIAIEVKAKEEISYSDAASLREFLKEYPKSKTGLVVHLGNEIRQLEQDIFAVPFGNLF